MNIYDGVLRVAAYPWEARLRFDQVFNSASNIEKLVHHFKSLELKSSYTLLSFDCDTERDGIAAVKICKKLAEHAKHVTLAVPTDLIEADLMSYSTLKSMGCEFINHGRRTHTQFDQSLGKNVSTFFYHNENWQTVEKDITAAHRFLTNFLSKEPRGFRAPHFGTFQRPTQLSKMYSLLETLGYQYSSSTLPMFGLKYGPAFKVGKLMEFPVSGRFSNPLQILDSWTFISQQLDFSNYSREVSNWWRLAMTCSKKLILNLYVDPAHVSDSQDFQNAISQCVAESDLITFSALLEKLKK